MFNNDVLNDVCTYKIRFMARRGKKFKQILADSQKRKMHNSTMLNLRHFSQFLKIRNRL